MIAAVTVIATWINARRQADAAERSAWASETLVAAQLGAILIPTREGRGNDLRVKMLNGGNFPASGVTVEAVDVHGVSIASVECAALYVRREEMISIPLGEKKDDAIEAVRITWTYGLGHHEPATVKFGGLRGPYRSSPPDRR